MNGHLQFTYAVPSYNVRNPTDGPLLIDVSASLDDGRYVKWVTVNINKINIDDLHRIISIPLFATQLRKHAQEQLSTLEQQQANYQQGPHTAVSLAEEASK